MSLPYLPLYVDDYEADTAHLTLIEDGAYTRILRLMWRSPGCRLPADEAWLFRRLRAHGAEEQCAIRTVLAEFFEARGGFIQSRRLAAEYKKADLTSQRRSEAGKKGGRPKAIDNVEYDAKPGLSPDKARPKHPEPEPEPYKERVETYVSPPAADDTAAAVETYNLAAARCGWSRVQRMNKPRFAALKSRMKEAGGLDGWRHAIERAEASDFLCGRRPGRDGAFFASFDFITQSSSFTKLMEGNYDNRPDARSQQSADRSPHRPDPALEQIARLAGLGQP